MCFPELISPVTIVTKCCVFCYICYLAFKDVYQFSCPPPTTLQEHEPAFRKQSIPLTHFTTSLAFVITGSAPSTESRAAISFAP